MNEKLEERYKTAWLEKRHTISMDTERLVTIAVNGHKRCDEDEYCLSRNYSGEDACRCIRTVFSTPEHYELYLCLRQLIFEAEIIHAVSGEEKC